MREAYITTALSTTELEKNRPALRDLLMSNKFTLSDIEDMLPDSSTCRFSFMAGLAQNQPSRPRSFHSIGGLGSCSIAGLVL
ncbi:MULTISPECIES: hypothetical protein [unclassified Marinovum]|uniref:hypothetical protein n=1 Tax=unclassified Marinovum TaxID=2647166 RepID=UPI003EDB73E7